VENVMTLKVGDLVGTPCSIQLGPFPDERLVTVETEEGLISGFVKSANLRIDRNDEERGLVAGNVVQVRSDSITVRLFGSFFTTALGFASVRRNELRLIAA
jgi:hypothetical protein